MKRDNLTEKDLHSIAKACGVTFEGKTYDSGNRFEWLKTSIEFAMDDDDSKDELMAYMKEIIHENE